MLSKSGEDTDTEAFFGPDGHPDFVVNLSLRACGSWLTFSHLEAMGQYRAEWLQEVAGNNRELG